MNKIVGEEFDHSKHEHCYSLLLCRRVQQIYGTEEAGPKEGFNELGRFGGIPLIDVVKYSWGFTNFEYCIY